MTTRDTPAHMARGIKMGSARSTGRKYYDNNLMQEVDVDAHHSETHTKIERPQPIGLTSVPLKQSDDQQQGQQQQSGGGGGQNGGDQLNHNQPQGESAEHFIMYMEGEHSHPVAAVTDDRRVRPYNMKEGETALYHAAGSEQMVFMNDQMAALISLDGKSVKNKQGKEQRYASLRHVTKDMQSHKIDQQQGQQGGGGQQQQSQQQEYKHEGKEVNTEVRCTKDRIEFRYKGKVVAFYDGQSDTWQHDSKNNFQNTTELHRIVSQKRHLTKAYQLIEHDAPTTNGWSNTGGGGGWNSSLV